VDWKEGEGREVRRVRKVVARGSGEERSLAFVWANMSQLGILEGLDGRGVSRTDVYVLGTVPHGVACVFRGISAPTLYVPIFGEAR
jgi:hypothetical protein